MFPVRYLCTLAWGGCGLGQSSFEQHSWSYINGSSCLEMWNSTLDQVRLELIKLMFMMINILYILDGQEIEAVLASVDDTVFGK